MLAESNGYQEAFVEKLTNGPVPPPSPPAPKPCSHHAVFWTHVNICILTGFRVHSQLAKFYFWVQREKPHIGEPKRFLEPRPHIDLTIFEWSRVPWFQNTQIKFPPEYTWSWKMKGKRCFEQNTFGALLYPNYLKYIAKLAKPQVLLGSHSPALKCRIHFPPSFTPSISAHNRKSVIQFSLL